uniref:Uncharacterized protein n=1 Tax=Noccaea caerulescens TaxID=107243 RepID=A0A1J3DSZ5_NOCCA
MGDGNEIVKRSDGEEKRLAEDRISDEQVEKNELVGSSDEAKDDEEEVFEGPKPQSSEAEDLTPEETSSNERGVISYGKTESSLDVVENSEKATSNGSNLSAEDVSMENGNTHSFSENGIVSPENQQLVAEAISISACSEETGTRPGR